MGFFNGTTAQQNDPAVQEMAEKFGIGYRELEAYNKKLQKVLRDAALTKIGNTGELFQEVCVAIGRLHIKNSVNVIEDSSASAFKEVLTVYRGRDKHGKLSLTDKKIQKALWEQFGLDRDLNEIKEALNWGAPPAPATPATAVAGMPVAGIGAIGVGAGGEKPQKPTKTGSVKQGKAQSSGVVPTGLKVMFWFMALFIGWAAWYANNLQLAP